MIPSTRPDIIFIIVDDCGYADLGCTGQTGYRTPVLDQLAGEGVRFTQAYANAPLCTNTRVAVITGRYQYRLRIGLVEPLRLANREETDMGIPPGFPTMPSLLRGAGYRTALIGKWHLGFLPRYSPLRSGYDEFFGIMGGFTGYYTHVGEGGAHDLYEAELPAERAGYVTDLLSERARAYVEAAANSPEPYFLSLHYNAPHWPWSAPSIEAAARQREVDPAEMMEGGSPRIYGEMMENLDAGIGRVMDAVRRSGKDTLVVFTSDNGGERYSNIWPFVGRKWDLLEGGLRVPQIAWWPGRVEAGQVTDPGLYHDGPDLDLPRRGRRRARRKLSLGRSEPAAGADRTDTGRRAHAVLAHGESEPAGRPPGRLEIFEGEGQRVPVRHRI